MSSDRQEFEVEGGAWFVVRGLFGPVEIVRGRPGHLVVEMSGESAALRRLSLEQDAGGVILTEEGDRAGDLLYNGMHQEYSEEGLVWDGQGHDEPVAHVRVEVPEGTPVYVDVCRETLIEGVRGFVAAVVRFRDTLDVRQAKGFDGRISGLADVQLGAVVGRARLWISGLAGVSMESLRGSLLVEVSGAGGFGLEKAEVDVAAIRTSGVGTVGVSSGRVQRLFGRATGSSRVAIDGRVGSNEMSESGSAEVLVDGRSRKSESASHVRPNENGRRHWWHRPQSGHADAR